MILYGADGLTRRDQANRLLTLAAAEHWDLSPLPAAERAEFGKPFFPDLPERQFNLSHSGPYALCALDSAPVGVDIQMVKSWRPTLPGRVCSQEELDWLQKQPDLWRSFTTLWVMKESRVKQSGQGLRGSIAAISVPIPRPGELLYAHQGLWFRIFPGPDWVGAVCGTTPGPAEIDWRSLSPVSSAPRGCND